MSGRVYFDTTSASAEDLREYNIKASSQTAIVYDYFKWNAGILISPSKVWESRFAENTPITSIRRSITVLTNYGLLTKTTVKTKGLFGRPENCWTLR